MDWIKETIAKVDRMHEALKLAEQLGTLGKPDRSRQYPLTTEKQIVDAVNLALTKVRQVEQAKDKEIAALKETLSRYQISYTVVISIITGLAWEGLKAIVAFLIR